MLTLNTIQDNPVKPFTCDCKKRDKGNHTYNLHWGFGNSKLEKDNTISFNIPAFRLADGFKTCPMAGSCALVCYAMQGRYNMLNVAAPRDHNIAWLRSHTMEEFVEAAVEDIGNLRNKWVRIRIHDSGDFYSEEYLDAWLAIALQCPHIDFYAYTKRVSLTARKRAIMPANFVLVQSVGGKEDRLIDKAYPHSVIFTSHEGMHAAGYLDGTKSDRVAFEGQIKIGLVYHGVTTLTEKNKVILNNRISGMEIS